MHSEPDPPTIIALDDPTPRSARAIAVLVVFIVIGLLVAPLLIPAPDSESTPDRQDTISSNQQMCTPELDVPAFLSPITKIGLPGFMRLCDWLAPSSEVPTYTPLRDETMLEP